MSTRIRSQFADGETEFNQSRAIRAGKHVFASETATRWAGGSWLPDPEEQARHCLRGIFRSLAEVGAAPQNIVRYWVWQRHAGLAPAIQRARLALLGDVRPAVTSVMVIGFPDPFCDFQIEVEAVVDSQPERFSLDLAGVTTTELTTAWSRAIKAGTRVYVSCTAPIWPALPGANRTDRFNDPDPEKQALRCLEIIGSALGQAGAGFQDVVSSHLWLQNAADGSAVARAHASVFGSFRPASSMVVLQGYLRPQWHIEIETEAEVGTDRQNVSIAADCPSASRLEASQAVRAGNRVSVSIAGPCRDGEVLVADMSGQLQRCWTTILGALASAGAEAEHVVRARFYIRHPADGEEVARFTHLVFGAVPPAVSVLIVKGFMCPVARVEMEVEAIIE